MGKRGVKAVMLVLAAGMCFTVAAQENAGAGFAVKGGTPGAGVEISMPFTSNFGGRLGVNYLIGAYNTTQEGIEYKADLNLFSIAGFVDWHPTGGSFRLSGGLLYNGNKVEGKAKIGDTINIGDATYTAAQVGTLKAKATFADIAPYAGIGWDTSFGKGKQWGFVCDFGVVYQDSPGIKLTAKGGTLSDPDHPDYPLFLAELEKEQKSLEKNVKDFKWYPVITVGLMFRF